ncbi:MAG: TonB family protein [Bryobacteraceae bacterium]|nr:TonB family protein [Bryobacteraceae bacterium]
MFEQSILSPTDRARPWPMVASVTAQTAMVGLALLLPLVYTEHLPDFLFDAPPIPLPRLAAPEPVAASPNPRQPSVARTAVDAGYRPFVQPAAIPKGIPDLSRLEAAPEAPAGDARTGVPNSGLPSGFAGERMTPIAPPPEAVPKPAPVSSAPVRVSSGVQEAKLIRRVIPIYPALAKAARIQGTVRMAATIARDGSIQELQILDGHALLRAAAMDAVRQWLYQPTLLNGHPVEVITTIDVRFTLSN